MVNQIEKFTIEFFENLKCKTRWESRVSGERVFIVEDVPKSFEDLFGKTAPYKFSFVSAIKGVEFVGRGSATLVAMTKFLKGAGKATLLKIDFDVNPIGEIRKVISFKNCEIDSLTKRHRDNFFSRFTFVTTFRYLNEAERVVNEIYVHNGKVVEGNLTGYTVVEGKQLIIDSEKIKKDYDIARSVLKGKLTGKATEIGEILKEKVDVEIKRIQKHYENLIGELGGDLSGAIRKMHDVELKLRMSEGEERKILRVKLERLRKGLVKIGNDSSRDRILKEQEFTIRDAMHKYSLNVDRKLVNTTVIYYPVFSFKLFLKGTDSRRYVEMSYDPLTRSLNKLVCESCGCEISKLNLCSGGHISCDGCLEKCGECGKVFCKKCLKRRCSVCGKLLCKSCSIVCLGCGKYTCVDHMRKDCVSGDDRCVSCLRACMRCHGLANTKFFGEALDGSKVCLKCLGAEKRGAVMERVFRSN